MKDGQLQEVRVKAREEILSETTVQLEISVEVKGKILWLSYAESKWQLVW